MHLYLGCWDAWELFPFVIGTCGCLSKGGGAGVPAAVGVAFPLPEAGRLATDSWFIGGGDEDAAAPSVEDLPSTSIWKVKDHWVSHGIKKNECIIEII